MRPLLLILFFCLSSLLSFSQHRFTYLNIEDGLTENSVTDIYNDQEGYIWISTQDGVSQYDGYEFRNFNISNNDSTSLSDNFLWGFEEDQYGFIWCCSRDGLNRIDKKTGQTVRFYLDNQSDGRVHNQVSEIAILDNTLYALIGSTVYTIPVQADYGAKDNQIKEKYGLPSLNGKIYAFYCDKETETLYILTSEGLYNSNTRQTITTLGFNGDLFQPFLGMDRIGEALWFTDNEKIFSLNLNNQTLAILPLDFDGAIIHEFLEINEAVWVATNKGIFILKEGKITSRIQTDARVKDGLSSNLVTSLCSDQTGKIWVGTAGKGLCVFDPHTTRFKYISRETLGTDQVVRSVVQDQHGRLIVSGSKLYVLHLSSPSFSNFTFASQAIDSIHELTIDGFEDAEVSSLGLGFDGQILVGLRGNQLLVLDAQLKMEKAVSLPTNSTPRNVISDIQLTENHIWVATYHGVHVLDRNYQLVKSFMPDEKGLTTNYFLSVYQDVDQGIWLGSNQGMFNYVQEADSFRHYPYSKNQPEKSPGFYFISGFADFDRDHLWVATFGGGLSKLNKSTGTFEHFTTNDGLANNICNAIMTDAHQNIWLTTNKGISKFNTETEQFTNYSQADGLYFDEFNLGAAFQNRSGDMLCGTPSGIVVFHSSDIVTSDYEPNIVVSAIDINYKNESQRLIDDQIHLYPEDKAITFHFAGLNFSDSPKIRYRYKLMGYNDDWIETTNRMANYTSLPDGEFRFMVNVTNADGVWNQAPREVLVVVHPPFYKTWWFLTLAGLSLIAVSVLAIRLISQRKIRKHMREHRIKQEIQQEKQRISRDLHDNIGAQITYLISSIDQEAYAGNHNPGVLEKLSDNARNMMTQLRQTIWVINKEAISLEEFVQKSRDHTAKLFSAAGIGFTIDVEGDLACILPPAVVSNLFRVIQEAQNNVVKHAEATAVKMVFEVREGSLKLSIQDNGKGFEPQKDYIGHYGLKNMTDRIKEINGTLEIQKVEGTLITIKIPVR